MRIRRQAASPPPFIRATGADAFAAVRLPAAWTHRRRLAAQARWRAAIDVLPEADRLPVMLFYLAGYAQQEIATIMELPLTTIKKRLFHARQAQ